MVHHGVQRGGLAVVEVAILELHPRVRDVLEEHYIARASDPEAAAIRGTTLEESPRRGTG